MAQIKDKLVTEEDLKAAYDNLAVKSKLTTQDLNAVTTPGFYNADGENTCTNKPSGVTSFGMLVIHSAGGNYYVQLLYQSGSAIAYKRINSNGTWTDWEREVNGVKGNAESEYRTGNVNLTPANIGAHPARSNLQVTNNSSYTGTPTATVTQAVAQIVDTNGFIRHQMYGGYNTSGAFYTYLAARRPNGSSADANQIAIGFDANGNRIYSVGDPAAFRSAIGVTPDNIGAAVSTELTSQDLNNVTTPGFYYAGGSNTCTNKPSGVSTFGMFVIHCASSAYYAQILYQSNSAMGWKRICNNGTWSSWAREVVGVKGNAESSYRTGNVNITPENIGAAETILFAYADTTAALIAAKLSDLPLNKPALCRLYSSNVAALTGKTEELAASGGYGTVVKTDANAYKFDLCKMEGNIRWSFSVTVTSSAITHDNVYRYAGTLMS